METSGYIQEVGIASTPVTLSSCKLYILDENGEYKEVGSCDFVPPGIRPINFHQYPSPCDKCNVPALGGICNCTLGPHVTYSTPVIVSGELNANMTTYYGNAVTLTAVK